MKTILVVLAVCLSLFLIWFWHPEREPDPTPLTSDQLAQMQRMLAIPDRTPEEWQATCAISYDFGPQERGTGHCSIQVIVDCPPDCGVYKLLQEDKLLHRIR